MNILLATVFISGMVWEFNPDDNITQDHMDAMEEICKSYNLPNIWFEYKDDVLIKVSCNKSHES